MSHRVPEPPPPLSRHRHFVESSPLSIPNIAALLTEFYNLLIRQAYFDPSEIAFPPHNNIDVELCHKLNLDPKVIEVMQSIPFPVSYGTAFAKAVAHSSRAFVYADPEDILASRDLDSLSRETGEDPNLEFLRPEEIPLIADMMVDVDHSGYILLLDVAKGTMRKWADWMDWSDRGDLPYPRPDDEGHYQNCPTRPAEEMLQELVDDIRQLEQIPNYFGGRGQFARRYWGQWPIARAKMIELGWNDGEGDSWDKEEWKRVKDEIWARKWEDQDQVEHQDL